MPELATGNPRRRLVRGRADQLGVDRVGHYDFVSSIERYHSLGHGCIQNDLSGLGCHSNAKSNAG